ncbi:hypothetical protein ABK040_008778 [Willaertia magna]
MSKPNDNIFNQIWEADSARVAPSNGIPKQFISPYIVKVCKLEKANNRAARENHQLFKLYKYDEQKKQYISISHKQFIEDPLNKTYKLCEALFDNYSSDQYHKEVVTTQEIKEEKDFLDAIAETKCMKIVQKYLGYQNVQDFKVKLKSIWFSFYKLNRYKDLSAFEHCCVGEKLNGKVSGYHFWYKYLLDDSNDNHSGKDVISFSKRLDNASSPDYVSIQFRQLEDEDNDGSVDEVLFKSCGSFFVGCSPECYLALSTVGLIKKLKGQDDELKLVNIHGTNYELVVFTGGDNDDHLRSFYPVKSDEALDNEN